MWFRYQFWGQIESLTYKTCRCGIASRWIEVGQVDQIASCRCPLSRDVSLLLCPKTPQDHLKIYKTRLPWFLKDSKDLESVYKYDYDYDYYYDDYYYHYIYIL